MAELKAPLQDGIEYKAEVISRLCASQPVISLLADEADIDLDGDEAYATMEQNIFDFNYVPGVVKRGVGYIMVDADMIAAPSGTMNAWELYVQVVCEKNYVPLSGKKFKGWKGNRLDNLTFQIDKLLNGTRMFGIGKLALQSCTTAVVPDSFSSKLLTYRVEEFRRER